MLTLPLPARRKNVQPPGAPNVDRLERPKGEEPTPMTQINAHVESEGLQLESLPRKRNLEKSALSSSARRRIDRRGGRQRVWYRTTGLWSVGLSLQLGDYRRANHRERRHGTECRIDALDDNSVTNTSAVS
jgi:hypothetical protein